MAQQQIGVSGLPRKSADMPRPRQHTKIAIGALLEKIEQRLALQKGDKVLVHDLGAPAPAQKAALGKPAIKITSQTLGDGLSLTITPVSSGHDAYDTGSRGAALLRGREQLETLLTSSGGTFDQEQVQTMLYGISRQAVDKRVRDGSLLAVPGPNGARRYPVCQFGADGSLIKGLKEMQAALPVRGPWSAFLFLMQPQDGLGGRKPLDALRDGDMALVIAAAKGLGAQGS